MSDGDFSLARDLFQQASDTYARIGDEDGLARVLLNLGWAAATAGQWDEAVTSCEAGVAACLRIGNRFGVAKGLLQAAAALIHLGRTDEARRRAVEGAALFREFSNQLELVRCLEVLAAAARVEGDAVTAASLLGATEAERRSLGCLLSL